MSAVLLIVNLYMLAAIAETATPGLCALLVKGFMIGPYDDPPFSTFRISPLGIATHKYSGKSVSL